MENTRILVVDDDKEIAGAMEKLLTIEGYEVVKAYNGYEALDALVQNNIQLIILDVMMPKLDGLSTTLKIRERKNIPIIILSAKSEDSDKILGLSMGADDYITKPFNPEELIARVKSQIRRYTTLNTDEGEDKNNKVVLNNLIMKRDEHKVVAYGKDVKLTPIEFDILYLLASHPGKVFSTDEIFEAVWHEKMFEANNTVMVHIRRVREKIEMDPQDAKIIKTVWGVGYKVDKDV